MKRYTGREIHRWNGARRPVMMRFLRLSGLTRLGRRGREDAARAHPLLVPSRDLPPIDADTGKTLPRSPEPHSEEELIFASRAAVRAAAPPADVTPDPRFAAKLAALRDEGLGEVATGAELRALLERFERAVGRRTALDQAADAQQRLVATLSNVAVLPHVAAAAAPMLRLVSNAADDHAAPDAEPGLDLEQEVAASLGNALDTLRRLSEQARVADNSARRRPTSPRP